MKLVMAPDPRVGKAFRAMRKIGIPDVKTNPVLKNLPRLYEKNWELIEEENYRALADAIFDSEDTQACLLNFSSLSLYIIYNCCLIFSELLPFSGSRSEGKC